LHEGIVDAKVVVIETIAQSPERDLSA